MRVRVSTANSQCPTPKEFSGDRLCFPLEVGSWKLGVVIGALCCAAVLNAGQPTPRRIISLIPAVTEMLFAIGAGPQVVAVSSFDHYPPEVEKLERVGALLDPDLEKILSLRPDLVIVYGSQADLRAQLDRAKVEQFAYRHAGLADVTKILREVGAKVGRAADAEREAARIERALGAIRERVAGRPKPRTLIVFGREAGALRGMYASGGIGFLQDMVDTAGGINIFADVTRESIQATTELILARRPDVVLDIRGTTLTPEQARAERTVWNALSSVPAVKEGRVYVIADERTVVPGPRVAEGTELLSRALHPDAWRH
jgi:iron complex transport system substrate-binding protein